ncbi:MAG: alpha/beta hydrolase fold domain-containing protein [Verrucomicrobiaceae bacterium]
MKSIFKLPALLALAFLSPLLLSADPVQEPPAPEKAKKQNRPSYLETGGERKLDLTYKTVGKKELKLDLYYPTANKADKAPLLIYTHGGGWAAGSRAGAAKGSFAAVFKPLLAEGFAVASVEYRLARNGSLMRNCVIDSKDALRYLVKNSSSLGLDPNQLFVFGDSAGGHLAQMLLLTPPDTLIGDPNLAKVSYQVTAGLSWYGPCDFVDINLFNHDDRPNFRNRFAPRILGDAHLSDDKKQHLYREMSPVTYLKKDSPPLLMIQGDKDTTIPVKHAHRMAKEAKKLNAPVKILIVKNAGHNWRKVDADIAPTRAEIIRATIDFFTSHLPKN